MECSVHTIRAAWVRIGIAARALHIRVHIMAIARIQHVCVHAATAGRTLHIRILVTTATGTLQICAHGMGTVNLASIDAILDLLAICLQ